MGLGLNIGILEDTNIQSITKQEPLCEVLDFSFLNLFPLSGFLYPASETVFVLSKPAFQICYYETPDSVKTSFSN